MKWKECRKQKVKEIKPNRERARAMRDLAVKRLNSVRERRKTDAPEFIVEDYYETIKELITALLFVRGFKSYSHECLISFLEEFHPDRGSKTRDGQNSSSHFHRGRNLIFLPFIFSSAS